MVERRLSIDAVVVTVAAHSSSVFQAMHTSCNRRECLLRGEVVQNMIAGNDGRGSPTSHCNGHPPHAPSRRRNRYTQPRRISYSKEGNFYKINLRIAARRSPCWCYVACACWTASLRVCGHDLVPSSFYLAETTHAIRVKVELGKNFMRVAPCKRSFSYNACLNVSASPKRVHIKR